jgi:hypothetical protein
VAEPEPVAESLIDASIAVGGAEDKLVDMVKLGLHSKLLLNSTLHRLLYLILLNRVQQVPDSTCAIDRLACCNVLATWSVFQKRKKQKEQKK